MKSQAFHAALQDPVAHTAVQPAPAPAEFERALFHAGERRAPGCAAPPTCESRARTDAPRAPWAPAPAVAEKPAPSFAPSLRPPAESPRGCAPRRETTSTTSSPPTCSPSKPARRLPYPDEDAPSASSQERDGAEAPAPMPPGPSCERASAPEPSPDAPRSAPSAVDATSRSAEAGACRAQGPGGAARRGVQGLRPDAADRPEASAAGGGAGSLATGPARRLRLPVESPSTALRSGSACRSPAEDTPPGSLSAGLQSPMPQPPQQPAHAAAGPDPAPTHGGDAFRALDAARAQEQHMTAVHAARAGRDADWQIELSTVLGPQTIRAHAQGSEAAANAGVAGAMGVTGVTGDLTAWTLAMPHPGDPLAWERLRQRTARRGWALEALGGPASSHGDDEGDEPEGSA